MITAAGPGTAETAKPASIAARARRSPGIGDPGRAGIGDDGDIPAGGEHVDHLADTCRLGVIVGDRQAFHAHPGVLEQPSGPARVLATDEPRRAQHLEGARSRSPRFPIGVAINQSVPAESFTRRRPGRR